MLSQLSFENLPTEIIFNTLIDLTPTNILNFICNKKLQKLIVDPIFWRNKLIKDFPHKQPPSDGQNYFRFYKVMFFDNQECIGNIIFNKRDRCDNQMLMKLLDTEFGYPPEDAFEFNCVVPQLIDNNCVIQYIGFPPIYILIKF